jgi:enoyl-CoA hydratase/carnithine racemase
LAYTDILYSVDDFVATITLNRPDKLNARTSEMDADVRRAVESAAADACVRAIVITGAGRGFCAGADMSRLSRLSAGQAPHTIVATNGGKPGNFEQKFSYLLAVPKPVFAAVNGGRRHRLLSHPVLRFPLHGGRRQADDGVRQARAHRRAWLRLDAAAADRTDERARSSLFGARVVDTAEADRLGLVRSLPADNFLAIVQRIAREMVTASSPRSIGIIKRQVFQSYFQSLAEAWAVADEEMKASFGSEDFKEGVAHFVEKRAAVFSGR